LNQGELAGAADRDVEGELAFGGPHLGDVDVEIAARVGREVLLRRFLPVHVGQAADAVALQTAVQRGAGKMRDGGLQHVEAVIQRRQVT
jgi:hypothetical protein